MVNVILTCENIFEAKVAGINNSLLSIRQARLQAGVCQTGRHFYHTEKLTGSRTLSRQTLPQFLEVHTLFSFTPEACPVNFAFHEIRLR